MTESRRVRDALTELESTLWLPGERLPEWEHKTQGGKNCQAVIRATGLLRDELTSDPWLPIEECGELEDGWYDVWVVKPEYDGGAGQFMHARRFPSGEFVVAGLIYEAQHITHVHQMGPIRGPGEG